MQSRFLLPVTVLTVSAVFAVSLALFVISREDDVSAQSAQSGRWAGCQPGAPTPSWATRDASGCLVVPGGGAWGNQTFLVHSYNLQNVGSNQDQPGDGWSREGCPGSWGPGCPACNVAMWDNQFNNYAPASTGGGHDRDLFQFNASSVIRHLLIKNTTIQNSWNCNGTSWSGPNGHSCSGQVDGNHSDLFQGWRGPTNDGGWLVMQDSVVKNADVEFGQFTDPNRVRGVDGECSDSGPGGFLFQGVTLDQEAAFKTDCRARGFTWSCDAGNYFAIFGEGGSAPQWGPIWFVNVDNRAGVGIRLTSDPSSSVIVIGGSGGSRGWPGPLTGFSGNGPGTPCNNGLYGRGTQYDTESGSPRMKIYCYDSIESALLDTYDATTCPDCPHKRPPFIELSAAGWNNPPTGGGNPPPADTVSPTVSITSPTAGQTFTAGQGVGLAAAASDNVGVTQVDFRVDGAALSTDSASPYTATWTATAGTHSLTAIARDAAGNNTTSVAVSVTVNTPTPDTTPPTVSLTSPGSGAAFGEGQAVTLAATASDSSGIARVEFQVDGAVVATDTTSPYSATWTATLGSHSLNARAVDASTNANAATSAAVSVTVNATPPPPPPSGDGLVLSMALDEGSGMTTADTSGQGHVGTLNGATWAAGMRGGALSFDGVNDSVNIPDHASLDLTSAMTLAAWVNPAATNGYRIVLAKTQSGTPQNYYLAVRGGNVNFGFYVGEWFEHETAGGLVPVNQWTHVAVTFSDSANAIGFYVNGTRVSLQSEQNTPIVNTLPLRLGASGFAGELFSGRLDDIRVYNRALSATEVAALASTTPPPPPAENLTGVTFSPALESGASAGRSFTIQIYAPGVAAPLFSFTQNADSGGKLAIPANTLPAGTYDLRVSSSHHLSRRFAGRTLLSNTDISLPTALKAGNLNNDNTVDSLDWSLMSPVWFTPDTANASRADINRSGSVTSIDFSFLARNWGQVGD